MGEAKIRKEKLRAEMLKIIEGWIRPATAEEAEIVSEIERLPHEHVAVYPPEHLEYMEMKPRECHANCRIMVGQDSPDILAHVLGWRNENNAYILHSVIRQSDNKLYCVTPNEAKLVSFEFIPDEAISSREGNDGHYQYSRKGNAIGYGFRRDPDQTIEDGLKVKERLLSGMDPYEAMKLLR